MDRVGGDETELLGFAIANEFGGLVPPIHDEVPRVGFVLFPREAEGFGVAVAKIVSHAGGSEEGRVADDVVGVGPFGAAGVGVVEEGFAVAFVGDFFAGDRVGFGGAAVPDGEGFAGLGIGRGIISS